MCTQDWRISPAHSFVKFLVQLLLPEMQHISYHQSSTEEEQGKNGSQDIKKAKEGKLNKTTGQCKETKALLVEQGRNFTKGTMRIGTKLKRKISSTLK